MSVFHVSALIEEFPWLEKLKDLAPEHWYPTDAKVQRLDHNLMNLVPGKEIFYNLFADPETACFFFSQQGHFLEQVNVEYRKVFGKRYRKMFRFIKQDCVGVAIVNCIVESVRAGKQEPYYVVTINKGPGKLLTFYKPPHGYTLEKWINRECLDAKQELTFRLTQVNKIY
ncbi:MAG: hypothetical protein A2942_01215 [Candidatus Lloydbacteria bacterium RIFCSPLOWO2_01_FULL_50_20]|uniref:Uncharacterized protein n=1 Tax=Candidatus Lloydbacteria bacterium RIFCSPLOWO2_01_FULL_50_20 TaxID=1798665 RepID=A0A1G2DIG5_9BACT|nr:MAG: hypothetical protein A2942_01215 [Candidatus Lloydbacteria bacterium RIFCSPLOWO2_01_FULL_50_20]